MSPGRHGAVAVACLAVLAVTGCAQPQPTAASTMPPVAPTSRVSTSTSSTSTSPTSSTSTSPTSPTSTSPTSTPASPAVDEPRGATNALLHANRAAATSVAIAFGLALNVADTRSDTGAQTAGDRAAQLATADLAVGLVHPNAAMLSQWDQLSPRQGWTTVTAQDGGLGPAPADTAAGAVRGVSTATTMHGADGWHTTPADHVYLVRLTRSGHTWSVSSFEKLA